MGVEKQALQLSSTKNTEHTMATEVENFRNSIEMSPLGILIMNFSGELVFSNHTMLEMWGYENFEELKNISIEQRFTAESVALIREVNEARRQGKIPPQHDLTMICKDGSHRTLEAHNTEIIWNGQRRAEILCEDITNRKQTERALADSEQKFRNLADNSPNMIFIHKNGRIVYANKVSVEIMGYSLDEFYAEKFNFLCMIAPEYRDFVSQNLRTHNSGRDIPYYDYALITKDGKRIECMLASKLIDYNGGQAILGTITDITRLKQAETALRQEQVNFQNSFEGLPFGIQIVNQAGKLLYVNKTMLDIWGYENLEQLRAVRLEKAFTPESVARIRKIRKQYKPDEIPPTHEITMISSSGEVKDLRVYMKDVYWSGEKCFQMIYEDITAHKRMETGIQQLNVTLGLVRSIDKLIVNAENEKELLQKGCEYIIQSKRYKLTWIGFLQEHSHEVMPVAKAGTGAEYIDQIKVTWDESAFGQGSFGTAIKTGKPCLINDTSNDPRFRPWLAIAALIGFGSLITFPMKVQGKTIGGISLYAESENAFSQPEIDLLAELAADLSTGIEKIRHKEEVSRTQQALADEAVRRRIFIEQSSDGIVILDQNGGVFETNKRFCEMIGYSPEQVKQLSVWDWDVQFPKDRIVKMINTITDVGPYCQSKHQRQDGSQYDVEISSNAAIFAGQKLIFCVCRDITERKKTENELHRSENKFAKIFHNSPDSIVLISFSDGRIVEVNESFLRLTGYHMDEVVGKTSLEFNLWRHPTEHTLYFEQLRASARVRDTEVDMLTKTNEIINCVVIGELLDLPDGTYILCIIRDITEHKKMREKLIITDRLASIGELASGMAHELNNPLTGMIGISELLLEERLPDNIKEDIEILDNEAKRMATVIKNMLIFARQHPTTRKLTDINAVIEKVLEMRAYEHKLSNIQIIKQFTEDLPEIPVDSFQLEQVFLNIIINAEYFMKEAHNRGTMTINTGLSDDNIKLLFTDDGPEIPEETLTHIFDPFFTTKPIGKGTGLGLSICHGIIASHNGRISAENIPGKGVTFLIELPITKTY
jgi:PAS domain S-box-containing protein